MRENERQRKIIEYFKKNVGKGYTSESLRYSLISQGYPRTTVDEALLIAHKELADKAPILKEKPVIQHEVIDEYDQPVKSISPKPAWKRWIGI